MTVTTILFGIAFFRKLTKFLQKMPKIMKMIIYRLYKIILIKKGKVALNLLTGQ